MQQSVLDAIRQKASEDFLSWKDERFLQNRYDLTLKEIESLALSENITPLRYKRNQNTLSVKDQYTLLHAHVAIIGCGGLGGHVAESLCRIGIGKLTLFDFDTFDEHNLNRQNFSTIENIGEKKVYVVKKALQEINPALEIAVYDLKFDPKSNDFQLLTDADAIVDAVDDPQTKLELAQMCKAHNKIFVHGAIAGMNGQFTTNSTLENLYRDGSAGVEKSLGNPSFSVTFAAAIQSAEVIKTLLNLGESLKEKILISNLLENEFILL